MDTNRNVNSLDSVMWRHYFSSRFCDCVVYPWSNRNTCKFIISLWTMLGLFHIFPNVLEDVCCCWQKPCNDIFFSLQATLQTSPAGHTTSFQMFNNTYKLYSYRLVVGKRAHCTDRSFLWSQWDLGVLLKWDPCKWVLGRSGETWATSLWWIYLGCPPGGHQPALSLPFHQQDRGKKIWQKARGSR